jgi:hypothetical protein
VNPVRQQAIAELRRMVLAALATLDEVARKAERSLVERDCAIRR